MKGEGCFSNLQRLGMRWKIRVLFESNPYTCFTPSKFQKGHCGENCKQASNQNLFALKSPCRFPSTNLGHLQILSPFCPSFTNNLITKPPPYFICSYTNTPPMTTVVPTLESEINNIFHFLILYIFLDSAFRVCSSSPSVSFPFIHPPSPQTIFKPFSVTLLHSLFHPPICLSLSSIQRLRLNVLFSVLILFW